MKRTALAAALLACTTLPLAQMYNVPTPPPQIEAPKQRSDPAPPGAAAVVQVDVPKYQCEPKPVFPAGAAQVVLENKRRAFERDLASYRKCMTAYIEERKATLEAHQEMRNAAISEYNATMKAINDAQGTR